MGDKFRKNKEVTKDDLLAVVKWKFTVNPVYLPNKLKYAQKYVDANVIRQKSNEAFTKAKTDFEKISCLRCKGIGIATLSVILTFYDPLNYGVFDKHVYNGLFGEQSKEFYSAMFYADSGNYIKVLQRLREEAKTHKLDARTIEKAYFNRDFHKPKKRKRHC